MEEGQNTIDNAQGFLDRIQALWNNLTDLVGKIPGVNGSLEDIIGGLIIAGITAAAGFIIYSLVSG